MFEALGEVSEDYPDEWGEIPLAYSKQQMQPQQMMTGLQAQIEKAAATHDDEIVAVLKEVRRILKKGVDFSLERGIMNSEWNEDDHPRGDDGKFTSGGGGEASEGDSSVAPTARSELDEKIANGEVSTTIDAKKQAKHVEGSKAYKKAIAEGKHPSKLTLTAKEQQDVVDKYIKSGEAVKLKDGSIRVHFEHDKSIGSYVSEDGSTEKETSRGTIHISKSGTHIVPDEPKED